MTVETIGSICHFQYDSALAGKHSEAFQSGLQNKENPHGNFVRILSVKATAIYQLRSYT